MSLIFKSTQYLKSVTFRTLLTKNKLINGRLPAKRSYTNQESNTVEILQKKLADNKIKNLLIYSCESGGSVRTNILGVIGSVILLGASYNTWYLFSSLRFKNRKIDENSGFLGKVMKIISSEYFKIMLCSTTAIIGLSILVVTMFFTSRSVNRLYLLKGGNSLGILTDGVFGKEFKYVLDLGETSFNSTRKARISQVSFKNKNYYSYFLLNNLEGIYHEKEVFDHVICVNRFDKKF